MVLHHDEEDGMTHLRLGGLCVGLGLLFGAIRAGEPKQPQGDPAKTLIDLLPEVSEQDIGYSSTTTGTAFLPFGRCESHAFLLGQRSHVASDAMRSLVKLGVAAVPSLLDHL